MADRHDVNNTGDVNHDVPDPSQSLRLSPPRQRPDSGYNTSSPATTNSPAPNNTPNRREHFFFEDVATPTRLRVSPEIFRVPLSPREVSPGPAFSDSQVTQFHMESDEEDDASSTRRGGGSNFVGFQLPNLSNESDETADESNDEEDVFYSRGNILSQWGVSSEPQTPRYRSGSLSLRTRRYCMLEDESHTSGTEVVTAISGRQERGRSLRHEVFRGRTVRSHSFSAFRGHCLIRDEYDPIDRRRQEELSCRSPGARGMPLRNNTPSPLVCEAPSHHSAGLPVDSNAAGRAGHEASNLDVSTLEDSVFSFDLEDINAYHQVQPSTSPSLWRERPDVSPSHSYGFRPRHNVSPLSVSPSAPRPMSSNTSPHNNSNSNRCPRSAPVVIDRPPQSPASVIRRRRMGVVSFTTHVRLSSGQLLPCIAVSPGGTERTVSTQTPHATCTIIQQLIDTPAPLPSQARGTAADRLRHYSDGSPAWPGSPPPLPDIVPTSMGRDRSASAPDLRARAAGREAGRELRRLSDEFFNTLRQRRRLSPVREDFGGHPASYPRMRVSYIRHVAGNFSAFLSETFGPRRGSSVDLTSEEPRDV